MNKSDIGRLAEEHGKYIYGFCLRLTNDTYNAEELYQDTFLKALEKASSIDENNNPRAYLAAIALSLWKSSFAHMSAAPFPSLMKSSACPCFCSTRQKCRLRTSPPQ